MEQTSPDSHLDGAREGRAAIWLSSFVVVASLLVFTFRDGLLAMVESWSRAEYSHGYLIPVIAIYLAWRNRQHLREIDHKGAWLGAVIAFLGLAVFLMGELGTLYTVIQYAFLMTLFGVALACVGWKGMRALWVPLIYLVFMIPLPSFLYNGLSSDLQLISSNLGVAVIRLFGISVFLSGNVIDLGVYKLQVVEACSGLRYLFPLMSFGFLCACLFRGPFWLKAVFFLSTIPITILMNSFRIGVIGVLVEYYGIEAAEGFLHDFEGWFIFMACVLVLFGEVWLFSLFSKSKLSVFERFQVDASSQDKREKGAPFFLGSLPRPYITSLAIVAMVTIGALFLSERSENELARKEFVTFPMRVDEWRGRDTVLRPEIVETLKVDDYMIANFGRKQDPGAVNLYVAYYGSQRKGQSVHSPQSCIPGDGWRIESFDQRTIDTIVVDGQPLKVNRAVIAKGDLKQLVYYWFPQRDRLLTNEYVVKWFIFWDALTRNRTDGALVRLVTPVIGTDGMAQAEKRLREFVVAVFPNFEAYLGS